MGRIETVRVKCDKSPGGFYVKNKRDMSDGDTIYKVKTEVKPKVKTEVKPKVKD